MIDRKAKLKLLINTPNKRHDTIKTFTLKPIFGNLMGKTIFSLVINQRWTNNDWSTGSNPKEFVMTEQKKVCAILLRASEQANEREETGL